MLCSNQRTVLLVLVIIISGIFFSLEVMCDKRQFNKTTEQPATKTSMPPADGTSHCIDCGLHKKKTRIVKVPKNCPPNHIVQDGNCKSETNQ